MERQALVHPADETLVSYGLGKLDETLAESVNKHLEQCDPCRQRVAQLSSDSFVGRLRNAQPQPGAAPTRPKTIVEPDPPRPSRVPGKPAATAGPSVPPGTLPAELTNHPQYEVLRELGRGGMGVVYLARNKLMDRLEVLKVLNKEMLAKQGRSDRFLREIQSAARLHHPNVVAAYTALQIGDLLVFAMEYVEGDDLAKLVHSRGPLPVLNACYFAYQAAQGLQHAHECGMIHRDIKPGNLILFRQGKKGTVKILDFGLAKVTSERRVDGTLTQQGQMLGTPDYIAPEQTLDAQKADIRADIYSLGCTLYHLLTGNTPFSGNSLYEVLQAHHSVEAKPLNLVRPEVPVELAAVVAKMMAKEPNRRYQTPAEVIQALKPFLKPGGLTSPQPEFWQDASHIDRPVAAGSAPTPGDDEDPHLAPMEAVRPTERWKSLIDMAQFGRSAARSAVRKQARRQPPWMWPSVAVGALLLGVITAWASGVFSVKTKDGLIVIENLPEQAKVYVDGEVATVRPVADSKAGEISVRAGNRRLEVKQGDVTVAGETVSIASGETKPLRIHLEPPLPTPSALPPTFKNSLGMEFVLVPKGKSWLGGGGGRPGDKEVVFAHDFYLGKYEVTQEEWEKVTGLTPSSFSRTGGGKDAVRDVADAELKRFPVEKVSWDDVQLFLERLNKGEKDAGWAYCLPSAAKWEYACRGGPLSDKFESAYDFYFDKPTNQLLPEQANFAHGKGLKRTCKVGSYQPNRLGLYDMHGNVLEWCDEARTGDGASLRASAGDRGGSYGNPAGDCRPTAAYGDAPGSRNSHVGFRVARVPVGQRDESQLADAAKKAGTAMVKSNGLQLLLAPFDEATAKKGQATWASHLKTPVEFSNAIGMKLALIPPGEFQMGSADTRLPWDTRPVHRVRITKPFYMGVYEVTQAEFKGVMGSNPSPDQSDPRFPVTQASWESALEFLRKLAEMPEEKRAGRVYRIPTEAEWEYACRAGTQTLFYFGDVITAKQANFVSDQAVLGSPPGPSRNRMAKVGSYPPNAFGLYDMHGNAAEAVLDWYAPQYYAASPVDDPKGPSSGQLGIGRGGSCLGMPTPSSYRLTGPRSDQYDDVGFRVVCDMAAATIPGGSSASAATAPVATNGFVPLFSGKDLTGWHTESEGSWTVQDGILVAKGSREIGKPLRLVADQKSYRNFKLFLRILNEDSPPLDAIIRFSSNDDHHDGYRIAMVDEVTADGAALHRGNILRAERFHFGDPIPWKASAQPSNVAPGEWYTVEITAIGGRISTAVNGVLVAEYEDPSTSFAEGGIVLAGRSDAIAHIKEIKIKELPPTAQSDSGKTIAPGIPPGTATNERFVSLFSGTDLTGWTEESQNGTWTADAGTIVAHGENRTKPSCLLTDHDYANFILRAEFNCEKGSLGGIALRAVPDENLGTQAINHPKILLLNSPENLPTNFENGMSRWILADVIMRPDRPVVLKSDGSWNQLEVELNGGSLRAVINGTEIWNLSLRSDLALQGEVVPCLRRVKGRIGLEQRLGTISFRKIEIQERPATPVGSGPARDSSVPAEIALELDKARRRFAEAIGRANHGLDSQLDEQIRAVRSGDRDDKQDLLATLEREKREFSDRGIIPWSKPMRRSLTSYARDLQTATNDLEYAFRQAIEKATEMHKVTAIGELLAERRIVAIPRTMAEWKCTDRIWKITLYANERIDTPEGAATWSINGENVVLNIPHSGSPTGVYLDRWTLSPDGKSFTAENQFGGKYAANRIE